MTIETEKITIGDYIFKRLSQVTKSVFGVPGDYNLKLLEHLYNFPKEQIKWVACNNELNAGYAADGYACLNGFSCLISTFGVGELSAMNAIAHAFVENRSVLHIVGISKTRQYNKTRLYTNIHHLLPPKEHSYELQDHKSYIKLADGISCCSEVLSTDSGDLTKVQQQIDNVIEQVFVQMRPGYLFIPNDISELEIDVVMKPLRLTKLEHATEIELATSKKVAELILNKLYAAKNPAFIIDSLIKKHTKELNAFFQKSNFYCYTTNQSRGAIDETLPNFHGVFTNLFGSSGTLDILKEENDVIIHLGSYLNEVSFKYSDKNTENKSWLKNADITFVGRDYAAFGFIENHDFKTSMDKPHLFYPENVNCEIVLEEILNKIDYIRIPKVAIRPSTASYNSGYGIKTVGDITHDKLSVYTSNIMLKANDVLVNDMCSFVFELENVRFPSNIKHVSGPFYASIGYALPATVGVCMALKDMKQDRRVILIQSDGAAQMTLQELSAFIKYGLTPIIYMINNSGYTIERAIEGPTRDYNDIMVDWDWQKMFNVFGDAKGEKSCAFKVKTFEELGKIDVDDVENKNKVKLVELILDKFDYPSRLRNALDSCK